VTSDQIQAAAQKYLAQDSVAIALIRPPTVLHNL
jgi:hypothetical protein